MEGTNTRRGYVDIIILHDSDVGLQVQYRDNIKKSFWRNIISVSWWRNIIDIKNTRLQRVKYLGNVFYIKHT